jgi:hypothetical protein
MIENIDKEKAENIINGINSITISNNNEKDPQNQDIQNMQDIMQPNSTSSDITQTTDTTNINNNNSNKINLTGNSYNNSQEVKHKKKDQKGMIDLAIQFPIANPLSKVEIPFAFQQNLNGQKNSNRFHSYITIKDTPKLYIDISDDNKMDKFLLSNNIESLKATNQKHENKLQTIDTNIMQFKNDNDILREEIEKLNRDILIRNNNITHLKNKIKENNITANKINNEMNQKLKEKNEILTNLQKNYENYEKGVENIKNNEESKSELLCKIQEDINIIQKNNYNNLKFYKNKFIKNVIIPDEYIHKSLQKDIIDFMNLVTYKISIIKPKVNELIDLIQKSVEKSIGKEYTVKLYGSHATGLCLPWSDIDVVLCKENANINQSIQNNQNENLYSNKYIPLHDLFNYLQKNNDFKSINYIGATSVPLIKIKTKENIDIKNVDISLQDNSHYGIKCVSLVLDYKKEYEVLLPMVLALKNILKQAKLNDPYTVSIYLFLFTFNIYRED